MRLLVMGAGKVGAQIAGDLHDSGHTVVLIESDRSRAETLANTSEMLVVNGDGTDLSLLGELSIRPQDFFLALTGIDRDNLVACELVRATYGVTRLLARLNDPKNNLTFNALDIEYVSVTDLLASVITDRLDLAELGRATLGGDGGVAFVTVLVPEDSASVRVHEIELPPVTVLVAIEHERRLTIPNGDTMIEPGDRVVVLTGTGSEDAVISTFADAGSKHA